jgi:hypothetical protein
MPVVLVQWILEAIFLTEQALCPLRTFLIAENPAIHVLRFDHENAVPRDNNMVDLGRPVSVLESNVVDRRVDFRIEQNLLSECACGFADPAFDK